MGIYGMHVYKGNGAIVQEGQICTLHFAPGLMIYKGKIIIWMSSEDPGANCLLLQVCAVDVAVSRIMTIRSVRCTLTHR